MVPKAPPVPHTHLHMHTLKGFSSAWIKSNAVSRQYGLGLRMWSFILIDSSLLLYVFFQSLSLNNDFIRTLFSLPYSLIWLTFQVSVNFVWLFPDSWTHRDFYELPGRAFIIIVFLSNSWHKFYINKVWALSTIFDDLKVTAAVFLFCAFMCNSMGIFSLDIVLEIASVGFELLKEAYNN